jgi:hypothetical protein
LKNIEKIRSEKNEKCNWTENWSIRKNNNP